MARGQPHSPRGEERASSRRVQEFEGTSSRTRLRTSVVMALSGVAGARGVTGAMKAAALERSAKATTSFIIASCFLSLGSMLAFCTVTENCEMQRTAQQAIEIAGYVFCRDAPRWSRAR